MFYCFTRVLQVVLCFARTLYYIFLLAGFLNISHSVTLNGFIGTSDIMAAEYLYITL